jgi:ribosome-associated translation inhibitor RaiA
MQIHWRNADPISAEARRATDARIERLAQGHRDLVDVWVDVAQDQSPLRGAEQVAIRCQARGTQLVAHGYAAEPEMALRDALQTFEREVKRMRERRESRRSTPQNGSAPAAA